MFGVDSVEFLVVAVVALLVIGPKDLPHVLRKVGGWVGRARGVARHFRSGLDTMIRESELDEMEKSWRAENDRIMREHPIGSTYTAPTMIPATLPETTHGATHVSVHPAPIVHPAPTLDPTPGEKS